MIKTAVHLVLLLVSVSEGQPPLIYEVGELNRNTIMQHKSTLSGVDTSQANVSGQVNTDLAKAKAVTRDDTYASTQFSFEVADIVELGQRAKNKLRSSTQEGIRLIHQY